MHYKIEYRLAIKLFKDSTPNPNANYFSARQQKCVFGLRCLIWRTGLNSVECRRRRHQASRQTEHLEYPTHTRLLSLILPLASLTHWIGDKGLRTEQEKRTDCFIFKVDCLQSTNVNFRASRWESPRYGSKTAKDSVRIFFVSLASGVVSNSLLLFLFLLYRII